VTISLYSAKHLPQKPLMTAQLILEQLNPVGLRRLNQPLKQELTYKLSTSTLTQDRTLPCRAILFKRGPRTLHSITQEVGKICFVMIARYLMEFKLLPAHTQ
jgi:hypothetical protein